MKIILIIFSVSILFLQGCKEYEPAEPPLFTLMPPEVTGISFVNPIEENDSINVIAYEYVYNGGGVAILDVDNNGLPDIYFTANRASSKLYLNTSDRRYVSGGNRPSGYAPFQFEDITASAGVGTEGRWANGIAIIDINADGYDDIYVCYGGPYPAEKRANQLFINKGDHTFEEKAQEYGLADTSHTTQAAFLDYDKDGDMDVFLLTTSLQNTSPGTLRPKITNGEAANTDKLYRNEGMGPDGHPIFTDVSQEAGIKLEGFGLGVGISDINQDGWSDIYVSNDYLSNDILYINNQDGTFTDQIAEYMKHQSYSAMGNDIADFNNDGLVDIFILDMLPEDNRRQKLTLGSANYDRFRLSLQYKYEPQYMRNTLQLNQGAHPAGHFRGGHPTFSEVGQLAGVHNTDWSWSALFGDYDNDGYKDLVVTNGFPKDLTNRDFMTYRMQQEGGFGSREFKVKQLLKAINELDGAKVVNYLFKNNGADPDQRLTFTDMSATWGFQHPSYSNGAAFADLDQDGDLDLIINNINESAFVYRNNANEIYKRNYLRIHLKGDSLNKVGLGAWVEIGYDGKKQFHEQNIYRGYKSTIEHTIHYGLGEATAIDYIKVKWPDGKVHMRKNVAVNQKITVDYKEPVSLQTLQDLDRETPFVPSSSILREVALGRGIIHRHAEEDYADFKVQPLLPHKYSQNGPGIAVGDVDGDGKDDFYVGGSYQHPGKIFRQEGAGSFTPKTLAEEINIYEDDMGALFFDADQDGDQDLYIVRGGGKYEDGSSQYQDRLYINDGAGNFKMDQKALPLMPTSGACVTAADYDQDGDLDLFVGGRVSAGKYPLPPRSYILRNDTPLFSPLRAAVDTGDAEDRGVLFTDITQEVCPSLASIGMVTSALWTDFDQDGQSDLMLVGEGMPITFFHNQEGRFTNVTQSLGLQDSQGAWNSLVAGDFDADGDIDYIAGNLGLNTKYKATPAFPVQVYADDFDNNGSIDPIMTHYLKGVQYPVHPLEDMVAQMVGMKRKFPRYADYARATIHDVLSAQERENAYVLTVNNFRTCFIENLGEKAFRLKSLPIEAQTAPIFGMISRDVNNDGNLDVLMVGNSYAPDVGTGRYDAFQGLVLYGDGRGNFVPALTSENGLFVDGDAKGMATLCQHDGTTLIVVGQNKDSVKAFTAPGKKGKKLIRLCPLDAWATLEMKDGSLKKLEFYYGEGYLSQSSRSFSITEAEAIQSVTIYDYAGKARKLNLQEKTYVLNR